MWGGIYGRTNATTICTVVNAFLCPSDTNPAPMADVAYGGDYHAVAATSYGPNLGLNRFNFGGKINGPVYTADSSDQLVSSTVKISTFTDGTSNTVVWSEWIKGKAGDPRQATDGLHMVYDAGGNLALRQVRGPGESPTGSPPRTARTSPVTDYSWKGEWWAAGGHPTYSHTQTPNRRSCFYDGLDSFLVPGIVRRPGLGPRHHHDDLGQLQPPRRRELPVHGRDRPVHQELGELPGLVWPGDPGRRRDRQLRFVLDRRAWANPTVCRNAGGAQPGRSPRPFPKSGPDPLASTIS